MSAAPACDKISGSGDVMSDLADRIAELRKRAADIASSLTALADRRKERSLDAVSGDKDAAKSIADLDFQSDALKRENQTISSALELAQERQRDREAEARDAKQRALEADAKRHGEAICALNTEIDMRMEQLAEVFARRASLLLGLANTGIVDSLFVARLCGKAGATRAACAHGLHRYIDIQTVSPQAMLPLADQNSLLLSIPRPRAEQATH
jgi:hypothetical protein